MNIIKYTFIGIILQATLMLVALQYVSFNQTWYSGEFKKLNITADQSQVENLFGYLNNTQKLHNSFYSEREILHLKDIQDLIVTEKKVTIFFIFLLYLLLILILIIQKFKEFFKTIFFSNIVALTLYIVLGTILYFNFEYIFIYFHQITFNNDYWILNPEDLLINTFPPQLFADMVTQIFSLAIFAHGTLFLASGIIVVGIMLKNSKET